MKLWDQLWASQLLESMSKQRPQPKRSGSYWKINPAPVQEQGAPSLLVFVIVAAIQSKKKKILRTCKTADDVMALFSTPQKMSLDLLLRNARKLFKTTQKSRPHWS